MAKNGRPFSYTAGELLVKFEQYVVWNKTQYIESNELIKANKNGKTIKVKHYKPLSVFGFCNYAKVSVKTYYNLLNDVSDNETDELFQVISYIDQTIKQFLWDGANLNLFNATITSRLTGLKDTIDINETVKTETINITIDGNQIKLD